jgi:hypothetical protein
MEHDIIIGGSMALASVLVWFAIVLRIARAVREAPRLVTTPETAPALRPTSGW